MAGQYSQSDFIDEITYKIFKHLHTSRYVCPMFAPMFAASPQISQNLCGTFV